MILWTTSRIPDYFYPYHDPVSEICNRNSPWQITPYLQVQSLATTNVFKEWLPGKRSCCWASKSIRIFDMMLWVECTKGLIPKNPFHFSDVGHLPLRLLHQRKEPCIGKKLAENVYIIQHSLLCGYQPSVNHVCPKIWSSNVWPSSPYFFKR